MSPAAHHRESVHRTESAARRALSTPLRGPPNVLCAGSLATAEGVPSTFVVSINLPCTSGLAPHKPMASYSACITNIHDLFPWKLLCDHTLCKFQIRVPFNVSTINIVIKHKNTHRECFVKYSSTL